MQLLKKFVQISKEFSLLVWVFAIPERFCIGFTQLQRRSAVVVKIVEDGSIIMTGYVESFSGKCSSFFSCGGAVPVFKK